MMQERRAIQQPQGDRSAAWTGRRWMAAPCTPFRAERRDVEGGEPTKAYEGGLEAVKACRRWNGGKAACALSWEASRTYLAVDALPKAA